MTKELRPDVALSASLGWDIHAEGLPESLPLGDFLLESSPESLPNRSFPAWSLDRSPDWRPDGCSDWRPDGLPKGLSDGLPDGSMGSFVVVLAWRAQDHGGLKRGAIIITVMGGKRGGKGIRGKVRGAREGQETSEEG